MLEYKVRRYVETLKSLLSLSEEKKLDLREDLERLKNLGEKILNEPNANANDMLLFIEVYEAIKSALSLELSHSKRDLAEPRLLKARETLTNAEEYVSSKFGHTESSTMEFNQANNEIPIEHEMPTSPQNEVPKEIDAQQEPYAKEPKYISLPIYDIEDNMQKAYKMLKDSESITFIDMHGRELPNVIKAKRMLRELIASYENFMIATESPYEKVRTLEENEAIREVILATYDVLGSFCKIVYGQNGRDREMEYMESALRNVKEKIFECVYLVTKDMLEEKNYVDNASEISDEVKRIN